MLLLHLRVVDFKHICFWYSVPVIPVTLNHIVFAIAIIINRPAEPGRKVVRPARALIVSVYASAAVAVQIQRLAVGFLAYRPDSCNDVGIVSIALDALHVRPVAYSHAAILSGMV